jgi:hypothetical protein
VATLMRLCPSSELSCGRPWRVAEAKLAHSEALAPHLNSTSP